MTIKIITDGSSDLPEDLKDQHNITIVPLSVCFGDEHYDSNICSQFFYNKMREEEELPKTSSPSPHHFLEEYKEAKEQQAIIVLSLSSSLSSTYNHAVMAKEMFHEEGFGNQIEVIDVKTTSMGLGVLAIRAAEWAKTMSFSELTQKLKQQVQETKTYFTLDTLENVIKGGRLSRLKGTVASVLNIKLLMQASEEGAVEVIEKIRGTQKTLKRLIDKVGETWHASDKKLIAFAHSNCEERARAFMKELLAKYPFEKVVFTNMGPVIGTYAGEGGILVAY